MHGETDPGTDPNADKEVEALLPRIDCSMGDCELRVLTAKGSGVIHMGREGMMVGEAVFPGVGRPLLTSPLSTWIVLSTSIRSAVAGIAIWGLWQSDTNRFTSSSVTPGVSWQRNFTQSAMVL